LSLRPRSLVARVTWLVGGVSMLSLLLHLTVVSLWIGPFTEDLAQALVGRVSTCVWALRRTPLAEREAAANTLSSRTFEVKRAGAADKAERLLPPDALPSRILEQFKSEAGADLQVRLTNEGPLQRHNHVLFDFELDGQAWRVRYAVRPPLLAVLGTAVGWLVLVGTGVFVSLAIGVRWITRPMSQLAQQLASQGELLRSLPVPPQASSELVAVVSSFNQLVHAVQQHQQTQQHMLAGVSHDLRTPLTRLRLRIETQCEHTLAEQLSADLHAVERIVSQFLAYVQGNSAAAHGEPESVRAMMAQAVQDAQARGHDVRLLPGDADASLPDLAVQRLLANLIDNALAHGAAPVTLALRLVHSAGVVSAVLTVCDAGPGLSAAQFARAQLPFVRLVGDDESAAQTDLGHCGLGLAIVAQIAHQQHIKLGSARREDGHFCVSLSWPTTPAALPARPG
jgi:two-component system, OmpR family, osmolarity sensor histidine kinase EnvZ